MKSEIISKLAKKYGGKILMYTEYPHKAFWDKYFGHTEYVNAWRAFLLEHKKDPLLLYIHMPYCLKQCLYCTCRVEIAKNYDEVKKYMEMLYLEMEMLRLLFFEIGRPNISEVHLGGGSPTLLKYEDFECLISNVAKIADIGSLTEFSIEIDPRHTDEKKAKFYANKGINRISIGVQDFDLEVQKAIDRVQPVQLTQRLMVPEIKALFKNGVNFDIICGLPNQTVDSIKKTMEKIIEMSPDRICFNYMDFAPRFNPHQFLMPQERIPGLLERKLLFLEAKKNLLSAGYVRAGYDHFALPSDAVAISMKNKNMRWNSLGVTSGTYSNVLGIGIHSYSTLGNCYCQNYYYIADYQKALREMRFPILRGYILNTDDVIRREAIQCLRNYFSLDLKGLGRKYNIDTKEYFRAELKELEILQTDGLVKIEEEFITITDTGQQFANAVCQVFDAFKS